MPIVFRHQKGGPLTIEEVDGNFADLDRRLKVLETEGIQAEGIAVINQIEDKLEIIGTQGSNFGRFEMPKATPQPKGLWQAGVQYLPLDWINIGPKLYACVHAHQSNIFVNDLEAGYWRVLVSAG